MTPATLPRMVADHPNHTPRHTVRVSDEVWQAALAKANARGETLSDVIREYLVRYAKRK